MINTKGLTQCIWRSTRKLFTVEEYYRLAEVGILGAEDRVELIDGEVIRMSPVGDRHAGCVILQLDCSPLRWPVERWSMYKIHCNLRIIRSRNPTSCS